MVVGRSADAVEAALHDHVGAVATHLQTERLGTAHAVLAAPRFAGGRLRRRLILFGDTPLVRQETLNPRPRLAVFRRGRLRGRLPHAPADPGTAVSWERDGELVAIREEKDASEAERLIDYCKTAGVMAVRGAGGARTLLDQVGNNKRQGRVLPDRHRRESRGGKGAQRPRH